LVTQSDGDYWCMSMLFWMIWQYHTEIKHYYEIPMKLQHQQKCIKTFGNEYSHLFIHLVYSRAVFIRYPCKWEEYIVGHIMISLTFNKSGWVKGMWTDRCIAEGSEGKQKKQYIAIHWTMASGKERKDIKKETQFEQWLYEMNNKHKVCDNEITVLDIKE